MSEKSVALYHIEPMGLPASFPCGLSQPCLAIECSGVCGSVAIIDSNRVTLARLARGVPTAKSIAPAIQELTRMSSIKLVGLSAIYCTDGPGSFTGLRIGLGIARSISFANKTRLFGVSSLATLAQEFATRHADMNFPTKIVTALNAFRDELFVAPWELRDNGDLIRLANDQRVSRKLLNDWCQANFKTETYTIVSPESSAFFDSSRPSVASRIVTAESSALSVLLAAQSEPPHQGLAEVLPVYMRGSAAEEKRSAKSNIAGMSTNFPTT